MAKRVVWKVHEIVRKSKKMKENEGGGLILEPPICLSMESFFQMGFSGFGCFSFME